MHPQHWLARLRLLILIVALPGLALPMAGCGAPVENLVTGERQRGAYTWAQEVQIGQENHPQILAVFGQHDDEALAAYVREVGQRVLEVSAWSQPETPAEIRNTPFHFHVLDSEVPNAMALPGGYIYVTRGLMAFLDNEAQLAVVLGHEIGHVLARHHSRRAAQQQVGQFGLIGAAILGGVVGGGGVAEGILNYGSAGVQLLFLSHSREAEREADRAGVAYAEFSDYDSAEAASFFRSLQRLSEQQGSIPSFLATHPDPGEREQTIPQLAAQYEPRGTVTNRNVYLQRINNIVIGENPRVGYTEGNRFLHPELRFRFSFPSGWRLANSAAAVQMAEPQGNAAMEFTFAQDQSSAQAAGQAFARQQGFQVAEQGALRVNGLPAYAVRGTAQGQQGQVAAIVYFIEHEGNVYRFIGMSAANAFGTFRNQFLSALNSFQTETDPQVLGRQPVRLEVVQVQQATPFRNLLSGRPTPPGLTQNDLAIMNEVELTTTIPAGRTVKLPRR